ncbi:MAG: signal peptidase I [Parachlamydiales bacterium]|jgi:signal peptidase I
MKHFRVNKARQLLQSLVDWYQKNKKTLPESRRETLAQDLKSLDTAILEKDRPKIDEVASRLDEFQNVHVKKPAWKYILELVGALIFALFIATIVRQVWFEFHEIPTGSMRPTYKEQDKLIVSKTAYGINVPFSTAHFQFDPSLITRTGVFTFSADNIPMYDSDGSYFGIFPYKKRLIKRVMGLPGDTLYFYGGKVYGIDRNGIKINEYHDAPWMQGLEYIPFITFLGELAPSGQNTVVVKQMNTVLGKISFTLGKPAQGQVYVDGKFLPDDPAAAEKPHDKITTYSDFWGIGNYAMVQLLTKDQVASNGDVDVNSLKDAEAYLEVRHNPSLSYPSPYVASTPFGMGVVIPGYRSYIPLKSRHLNALMDTLYTARFVVEGGKVRRYDAEGRSSHAAEVTLEGIEDGTYEFYHGKAYQIAWGGVTTELPPEHPLYDRSLKNIQNLFNYGIDFSSLQTPRGKNQYSFPHRYAYFRDGDFYIMGGVIMQKNDTVLKKFIADEKVREEASKPNAPYIAFLDRGPPANDEIIKKFGLHIPEKHYLALGDNHAMSGDSRVWGYVPEDNIQGAPSYLMWPAGSRYGWAKNEPDRPWITIPNLIVWSLAALAIGTLSIWTYKKRRGSQLPSDFDI